MMDGPFVYMSFTLLCLAPVAHALTVPSPPPPPCACSEDYPYCWGAHDWYTYEDTNGDHRCYASAISAEASTTVCVGTCTADYPTPPPPSPPPCACSEDYPYCWGAHDWYTYEDTNGDHRCYASATSDDVSGTICVGTCTSDFSTPSPPPCACSEDYPYCWGAHDWLTYEDTNGDHHCYAGADSEEASTTVCVGTCTADFPTPPPPSPPPCACSEDYPYCWGAHDWYTYEDTNGDHRCYASADSEEASTTACVGTCTADYPTNDDGFSSEVPSPPPLKGASLPPPPSPARSPAAPSSSC